MTSMSSSFRPASRERLGDRDDRARMPHDLRRNPGGGKTDEARQRLQAQLPGLGGRHDERRCGAVAGLRRVARRHGPFGVEDGP